MKRIFFIGLCCAVIFSCTKPEEDPQPLALMEVPSDFPAIDFPADNVFTQNRWALGKRLFYDPVMSVDSTISCASCHLLESAFANGDQLSEGVAGRLGDRNVTTLSNVAFHPYFTRDASVPTLEMQVLVPIQEHAEMDFNIVALADRLKSIPSYVEDSQLAYNQDPNPFVITRALANFERSFISANSPYDRFNRGEGKLSDEVKRGEKLFNRGDLACAQCHSGFDFTSYEIANNGLYKEYEDEGRYRVTFDEADRAMFKIPSLRNIALTSPYMHDGSINTLSEVIDHYSTGGENHVNKDDRMKPFSLSPTEKSDLIAFLTSLTDETFINNPIFK